MDGRYLHKDILYLLSTSLLDEFDVLGVVVVLCDLLQLWYVAPEDQRSTYERQNSDDHPHKQVALVLKTTGG